MTKLDILIDMDGVIADWSGLFARRIVENYPHLDFPFLRSNDTWDMGAGALDPEALEAIEAIKNLEHFYKELDPIDGAADALNEMLALGHEVTICTSPWTSNPTCASDKLYWLNAHIGPGWADRAIIAKDKTRVMGDILIDDRPLIEGSKTPTWTQIFFDQPYNTNINDGRARIYDWHNWKDVVNVHA